MKGMRLVPLVKKIRGHSITSSTLKEYARMSKERPIDKMSLEEVDVAVKVSDIMLCYIGLTRFCNIILCIVIVS